MTIRYTAFYCSIFFLIVSFSSWNPNGFVPPTPRHPRRVVDSPITTTALRYENDGARPEFSTTAGTNKTWHQQPIASSEQNPKNKFLIQDLASPQELLNFLETTESTADNSAPCVIFVSASWCKKCQRVGRQLHKVVQKFGGSVRFARLECTTPSTQASLVEALGVESVPNLRIYRRRDSKRQMELVFDAGSSIRALAEELFAMEAEIATRKVGQQ